MRNSELKADPKALERLLSECSQLNTRIRTPEHTNHIKTWQLTKVRQTNFTFFEVGEILVKKKKNLSQLRGTENSWRTSPKYRNGHTASKRTTHGNYTTDGKKGTRRQYSRLSTEIYPQTKEQKCGRSELALCSLQIAATDKLSLWENRPHNATAETFPRIHCVWRRCSKHVL